MVRDSFLSLLGMGVMEDDQAYYRQDGRLDFELVEADLKVPTAHTEPLYAHRRRLRATLRRGSARLR